MTDAPETERRTTTHLKLDPVVIHTRQRSRQDFSVVHMLAAARFSRQTKDAEVRGDRKETLQTCTACVVATVAALEAYANEVYFDGSSSFRKHSLTGALRG